MYVLALFHSTGMVALSLEGYRPGTTNQPTSNGHTKDPKNKFDEHPRFGPSRAKILEALWGFITAVIHTPAVNRKVETAPIPHPHASS